MHYILKGALIGAALGAAGYFYSAYAQTQPVQPVRPPVVALPFSDSVFNFNNSPYNFENSPNNFRNSPYNFDNSPNNYNAPNRVYGSNGSPSGYTTTAPNGVVNIFDFNGNRMGYVPAQ